MFLAKLRASSALALIVTAAFPAVVASAQQEKSKVSEGLYADEPQQVARALRALGKQGDRDAVRAIADRIDDGLPRALLVRAIDALVDTERRGAVRVISSLAQHRHPTVRARVAGGLAELEAPVARRVLTDLLDDPSPEVRAAAAEAIGELGAGPAMGPLTMAASRGVSEATLVVGRQARPRHVRRLLQELDAESLEALAPALRVVLRRSDLPRRVREGVVARLAEIGGVEVERLLLEVAASLPMGDAIRGKAEEAVESMHEGEGEASDGEGEE